MGDGTGIAWTDATWNPVRGCSRVSRGCEHCYAEGVARRFSGPGMPYEGLVRLTPEGKPKAQWNGTEWASRTIAQCRTAGVPAFVKQLGALTVTEERPGLEPGTWGWSFPRWADRKGGDPAEWPADLRVREFPQVRS